ncbi:MAG: DNA methyltransferase [Ruminococcus callidus]
MEDLKIGKNQEGIFVILFLQFWDDISIPYWSMPENTAHPAQKSEKLLAKLILASSNENDIVFDPFLGSGSTSVTAKITSALCWN